MVISNAGLNKILEISIPVLNCLYPVAIVLILLAFLQKWVGGFSRVYPTAILFTGVVSVIYALDQKSLTIPWLTSLTSKIPLYSIGLGWLIPSVIGIALGILLSLPFKKKAAPTNE